MVIVVSCVGLLITILAATMVGLTLGLSHLFDDPDVFSGRNISGKWDLEFPMSLSSINNLYLNSKNSSHFGDLKRIHKISFVLLDNMMTSISFIFYRFNLKTRAICAFERCARCRISFCLQFLLMYCDEIPFMQKCTSSLPNNSIGFE